MSEPLTFIVSAGEAIAIEMPKEEWLYILSVLRALGTQSEANELMTRRMIHRLRLKELEKNV